MKTLSAKLNESINEFNADNIDSLTEEIEMLYIDYFTEENTHSFSMETTHTGNTINRQITFPDNLNGFSSFIDAVNSTISDFNNKMKSMGQDEISATWKQDNILELR